jgi:A/G-specific adenine glycosylase
VFVARRADGRVLVRTRPPKGLLAGMIEVPTTEWSADFDADTALESVPCFVSPRPQGGREHGVAWRRVPGVVRHVFTHFPLELAVYAADLPKQTRAPKSMRWVKIADLGSEALPTLMRKVIAHALDERGIRAPSSPRAPGRARRR